MEAYKVFRRLADGRLISAWVGTVANDNPYDKYLEYSEGNKTKMLDDSEGIYCYLDKKDSIRGDYEGYCSSKIPHIAIEVWSVIGIKEVNHWLSSRIIMFESIIPKDLIATFSPVVKES